MDLEKDLETLDRSCRRWRLSAVVLGLALIASLGWGFDKKMDLDRAIVEEQKIMEAYRSLAGAFGMLPPTEEGQSPD